MLAALTLQNTDILTVQVVLAIGGILAILLGLVGGGIAIKGQAVIPPIPPWSRVFLFLIGATLISGAIWLEIPPSLPPTPTSSIVFFTPALEPATSTPTIVTPIMELPTPTHIFITTPMPELPVLTPTVTATPTPEPPPPTSAEPVSSPSSVRLDALDAIPAGWMSGNPSGPDAFIGLSGGRTDCYTGSDCIQITYRPGGGFGGIFWWPVTCGSSGTPDVWKKVKDGSCGINVLARGNLDSVNYLTFWARGNQGGEVIEFKIGAEDISPQPGRSLGKVSLVNAWQRYEIDLQGLDLTNAIALFAWVAADLDNSQETVFYLDDIQFEGMKQ